MKRKKLTLVSEVTDDVDWDTDVVGDEGSVLERRHETVESLEDR